MKIAIYARVSTDKQELDQQIDACKNFCKFKNFEVLDVYSDIGSGKDYFNRPNFNILREKLKEKQYEGLVVFRFDRLGRDMVESIRFFDEMEKVGIEIFSLNESIDTSTAIGRAIRDFIIRLAQLERENISESTKQRLQAKKDAGFKLGRPTGSKDKKLRRKSGYWLRWERQKKGVNNSTDKQTP